jgi:hypothetical protein
MTFKKSILLFSLLTMMFSLVSCEEDITSENSLSGFVGVEEAKNVGVVLGETVLVNSKIYATEVSSVDRVFTLTVDDLTTHNAADFVVPSTVTIPAGSKEGDFQVSITGNNIANAGNVLVLSLSELPGVNQNLVFESESQTYVRKKIKYNISEVCQTGTTKVKLSITFDNYPEETAWELYNSDFLLIQSGGFNAAGTAITGYAALGFADASTFVSNFCLLPGSYTFVIYDDYGDGMYTSATVSGSYSLKLEDGTILVSGGGNFGSFEDTAFTVN